MGTIDRIRTTAFRLEPEHFGKVYVYRPGAAFGRAWDRLEEHWRKRGSTKDFRQLPYRGLAVALRVLSGDFVGLQRKVSKTKAFVISRRPIDKAALEMAVGAWEVHALGLHDEPIVSALGDLTCEEVDVIDHVHRRPERCPTVSDDAKWVWDVALWEIAHRLAASPIATDHGEVAVRLDSDAGLLSWDRLVRTNGKEPGAAMHRITLHLMTTPGIEEPLVSMQSSLVRLAPTWKQTGRPRHAWADTGASAPLLRARVRSKRLGEGRYETVWDDGAADVLRGASLDPLPGAAAEPTFEGVVRAGYTWQPRFHSIGRGVGTWFHECVAHHGRRILGTDAVEIESTRGQWPKKESIAPRLPLAFDQPAAEPELRLLVVYANSAVRRRVRDSLAHVLTHEAHERDVKDLNRFVELLLAVEDDQPLRAGPLEVRFVRPPDAERWLLERSEGGAIADWLQSWLDTTGAATAAIVETDESAAKGDDDLSDPKPVLRGAFAQRGVVTQFITKQSEPKKGRPRRPPKPGAKPKFPDHAGANAVGDVLRSAGFFLRPFPEFGAGADTLVVGVYGTRITAKKTGGASSYLVNLVAVSLGDREAWGYTDARGWVPLDEATAAFLGSDQRMWKEEDARLRAERAIGQLAVRFGERPRVLLLEAYGCRRFWPCLADKADGPIEPWMRRDNTAVVRVRTANAELPRPAGVGDWDKPAPAKHTDFRPMRVVGAQGQAPTFVLSGSAVMSQNRQSRDTTRFAAPEKTLEEDWHSLGTTELLVLDPGRWSAEALLEQVAMLCRIAPTWDRTLRWPSPLHLARAVVRDHPHAYFKDAEEEEEEPEDVRQMRFDFDIYTW